jgi:hypothetical protein
VNNCVGVSISKASLKNKVRQIDGLVLFRGIVLINLSW